MAEKFNFKKAYEKIEEINEWFQGEDIDLDQALEKYKEGMELIEKCRERLKQTENKFEDIKSKYVFSEEEAGETGGDRYEAEGEKEEEDAEE